MLIKQQKTNQLHKENSTKIWKIIVAAGDYLKDKLPPKIEGRP